MRHPRCVNLRDKLRACQHTRLALQTTPPPVATTHTEMWHHPHSHPQHCQCLPAYIDHLLEDALGCCQVAPAFQDPGLELGRALTLLHGSFHRSAARALLLLCWRTLRPALDPAQVAGMVPIVVVPTVLAVGVGLELALHLLCFQQGHGWQAAVDGRGAGGQLLHLVLVRRAWQEHRGRAGQGNACGGAAGGKVGVMICSLAHGGCLLRSS